MIGKNANRSESYDENWDANWSGAEFFISSIGYKRRKMFVAFCHFRHLFVLTNCSLVPCESSFGNATWSPTGFQQWLCLGRFIPGSPKTLYCFFQAEETTAWLCSWRRDCLARELKWQLNLCSWILRWNLGCGEFLTWNFWFRSTGCPDCQCLALSFL